MASSLNSSPWIDDSSLPSTKKRIPSMRKTIRKIINPLTETETKKEETFQLQEWNGNQIIPRDEDEMKKEDREVHNLLEKMTLLNDNTTDDSLLGNFNPISYPSDEEENINHQILPQDYNRWKRPTTTSNYASNHSNNSLHTPSNYNEAYEIPRDKPYYASSSSSSNSTGDKTIADRLSYIVHLLEEQQNEKTNNTLEEYVLYLLLGTFVIFVVDSFSRGGKYIR